MYEGVDRYSEKYYFFHSSVVLLCNAILRLTFLSSYPKSY